VRQVESKCYLCDCMEHRSRPGKVRDDASLEIFECQDCGLVFLSRTKLPEGFYEQSSMHGGVLQPVEVLLRDTDRDDERRFQSLSEAMTNRNVLDFGCGVGGFLMKARSKASMVMGVELEARLEPHFNFNGLKVVKNIDDLMPDQRFDLITAFHVIEHLKDPVDILGQLATRLRGDGRIIIELPSSADALLTLYESLPFSEFTYWSCHLYLFNVANIELLARKSGLKLDYVSQIQRYQISNHLYWLAKGRPGGHQKWYFLDSLDLHTAYEKQLAAIGKCDTIFASISRH
jgi:SAM-dependent methyltransferase